MEATDKRVYTVAVLLYNSADILDFSGPLEIFANTTYNHDIVENPQKVFKPVTIARYVSLSTVSFIAIDPLLEDPDSLGGFAGFRR